QTLVNKSIELCNKNEIEKPGKIERTEWQSHEIEILKNYVSSLGKDFVSRSSTFEDLSKNGLQRTPNAIYKKYKEISKRTEIEKSGKIEPTEWQSHEIEILKNYVNLLGKDFVSSLRTFEDLSKNGLQRTPNAIYLKYRELHKKKEMEDPVKNRKWQSQEIE